MIKRILGTCGIVLGIILIIAIFLAIPVLGVLGIVYGSIDIAHGIITAKSICFVVFGSLGVLPWLSPIINIETD